MNQINHLQDIYERSLNDEKFILSKILIPEKKAAFIGSFIGNAQCFALHSMYVEKDFIKARQCFYKAAVSSEYMVRKYDWLMHTNIYSICYAILSDSSEVIDHYKELKNTKWNENFLGYQFNTAIQSVLKNDNESLRKQVEGLKKSIAKTTPKGAKAFAGCVNVFEGLLNSNKTMIEAGVNELIATIGKRGELILVKDFFSIETTALVKLAWRKGFDINVESSYVPKEMLPIVELPVYSGYDFFKEIGY